MNNILITCVWEAKAKAKAIGLLLPTIGGYNVRSELWDEKNKSLMDKK